MLRRDKLGQMCSMNTVFWAEWPLRLSCEEMWRMAVLWRCADVACEEMWVAKRCEWPHMGLGRAAEQQWLCAVANA